MAAAAAARLTAAGGPGKGIVSAPAKSPEHAQSEKKTHQNPTTKALWSCRAPIGTYLVRRPEGTVYCRGLCVSSIKLWVFGVLRLVL